MRPRLRFFRYFGIVVDEADGAEGENAKQREPDVGIAEVGPQKSRDDDRDDDQQAAHGRRAGFFPMRLRALLTNLLAEAPVAQFANHEGPEQESQSQSRQARERNARRDEAEDAKRRDVSLKHMDK